MSYNPIKADPRQAYYAGLNSGKRPWPTYAPPAFYLTAHDPFRRVNYPIQSAHPTFARQYQNGQASKWVSAFKISFSLLVSGTVNAFLFGVPLWIAGPLAAGISSMQSMLALKIHKEDTEFSRDVVRFTRKLMGQTHDYTPGGKEWSMVPVWGLVCGGMALVEATLNHAYKTRFTKEGDKPLLAVLAERHDALQEVIKKYPDSKLRRVYELQRKGVAKTGAVLQGLHDTISRMANSTGWKKMLGRKLDGLWQRGRSMRVLYPLVFFTAMLGGVSQTSIAAMMQERVDRRNGIK